MAGTKEFVSWSEGNDLPVSRGPKPNNNRKSLTREDGTDKSTLPLANYKRPTGRTAGPKISPIKSHVKDQNVASVQDQSQQKDRSVPVVGLEVSPEGPRFESASGVAKQSSKRSQREPTGAA
jgi:hypothetical protein